MKLLATITHFSYKMTTVISHEFFEFVIVTLVFMWHKLITEITKGA